MGCNEVNYSDGKNIHIIKTNNNNEQTNKHTNKTKHSTLPHNTYATLNKIFFVKFIMIIWIGHINNSKVNWPYVIAENRAKIRPLKVVCLS